MPKANSMQVPSTYDPRWFIWTIVFLVVSGISLVSYIVLSDNSSTDFTPLAMAKAPIHTDKAVKK